MKLIENKRNELTQYVPPTEWQEDDVQQYIYKKMEMRLNWIESIFQNIVDNVYIETMDEDGIKRLEKILKIIPDIDATLEDRRAKLLSILRGLGVTNVLKIKTIAKSFRNGDVEIIPHYDENYYIIKFVGEKGIPPRLQDLYDSINLVNPAHLGVKYQFNYERWGELYGNSDNTTPYRWGELKQFTWEEVLNGLIYHNNNWHKKYDLVLADGSNLVTNNNEQVTLQD